MLASVSPHVCPIDDEPPHSTTRHLLVVVLSTRSVPQEIRDLGLLHMVLKLVLHLSESQLHSVDRPLPLLSLYLFSSPLSRTSS